MLRFAVIGVGNSGARLLAHLRIPGARFILACPDANQDASGVQLLRPKNLPRLAYNYDCIFVAGDPCEQDFGQLVRALSQYLSGRISFSGAFLLPGKDHLNFTQSLRSIARHVNCCFRYQQNFYSKNPFGPAVYLQKIINILYKSYSGDCACIDLCDASALFQRNLDAFVCSAMASGPARSLNVARELAGKIAMLNIPRFTASLIHFSYPRDIMQDELANCCRYLEYNAHLGEWLFSASSVETPVFTVDILCALPFECPA